MTIRETITFKFEDEAQQARFHAHLKGEDFASANSNGGAPDPIAPAILAEREACAKLADLQAALDRRQSEKHKDVDNSFNDCAITAESIARAIRFRTELSK